MTPARSPGRHLAPARGAGSASHYRAPPPRSVFGLLAAGLLLALSLVLVVAPVALAEEEDGASVSDSSTDTGATDTGEHSEFGDYGVGGYGDQMGTGGSPPPGESTGSPSWGGGHTPTQHEVTPPGPASLPTSLPGTPARGSIPNLDTLGGVLCCATSGPGGNTGPDGHHESAE
jgi:hypothetical protein